MLSRAFVLAGLSLAIAGGAAAAQPPAVNAFPPDVAAQVPPNLRGYFLAFLVSPAEPRPMPHDVFIGHLSYMRHQVEAGIYHLAGPFTDEGRIGGIIILSAGSIEEARAIVAADPSIEAHMLDVEIHPALFPSLASLRIEYPPRH